MNNNRYYLLGTLALVVAMIMSGYASSKKFHRDAAGVLKTETRAATGTHKSDK